MVSVIMSLVIMWIWIWLNFIISSTIGSFEGVSSQTRHSNSNFVKKIYQKIENSRAGLTGEEMGVLRIGKSIAGSQKKTVRFAEDLLELEPLNYGFNRANENVISEENSGLKYSVGPNFSGLKYSAGPNFPQVIRTTRPKYVTKAKTTKTTVNSYRKQRRVKGKDQSDLNN